MMVRRRKIARGLVLSAATVVAVLAPVVANAGMGYAVVPTEVIYPGETVTGARVEEVEVTNPNLAGDYAKSIDQVVGRVTKRTLLPGRTISVSALREAYTVTRGSKVRLVFNVGNMTISAAGTPLEDATTGQVIRARNMDSGIIVSGTVLADGTVHVVAR
ncbi:MULTISPECIES: flagellar basal body P-ring formation chaperone FlgA [unclassified Sinorhizobium]|uniref:flagellar basal body P-ring formation chaperone FlgA n=1 Tax=unclassified Sinorhizobium TaxID=2613772 RepID=UPI00352584EE